MIYVNCTRCGTFVGQARNGHEAKELTKIHRAECDDAKP